MATGRSVADDAARASSGSAPGSTATSGRRSRSRPTTPRRWPTRATSPWPWRSSTPTGPGLAALARVADDVDATPIGDDVTYAVNRNINFTNVCYVGCRFCAFAQRRTDADAYTLSLEQVGDRVAEAWDIGATEVCIQGGIHPDLPGTAYFDLAREVKKRSPEMHLHAFSPMEVMNGATRSGLSVREWLSEAKAAGLDTIPGTAAEILDDEVRWVLTKGKLPTATWVDVVTTAHSLGIRSSSTMMYGHVDTPVHWYRHLLLLRGIQEQTGGFTEFVPLPFVHHNSPVYLAGVARPGPTRRDNVAVHAMARLLLHGAIDHMQTSWVKLDDAGVRAMLAAGVDDLGGTLDGGDDLADGRQRERFLQERQRARDAHPLGRARPAAADDDLRRGVGRAPGRGSAYGWPSAERDHPAPPDLRPHRVTRHAQRPQKGPPSPTSRKYAADADGSRRW